MHEQEPIALAFKDAPAADQTERRVDWRGCSVQYTAFTHQSEYEFKWTGKDHYLALHDLVFEDGRLVVDEAKPQRIIDLRNKISYFPPDCEVSGWARPRSRPNNFLALYFDPEELNREIEPLYKSVDPFPMVHFEELALRSTLQKLQALLVEDPQPQSLYGESLALVAAIEAWRLQTSGQIPRETRTGKLSAAQEKLVRDYIEENFDRDVGLTELAGVVKLSRFHFARAFKATTGLPPHQFVLRRRVERAKELLQTSTMTVADVAGASGFNGSTQFIRSFREVTGLTPANFRKHMIFS